MITYQIGIKKPEVEHILDTQNLNKEDFIKEVEKGVNILLTTLPETWNPMIFSRGLSGFNKILQTAAENNCNMVVKKVARDPNPRRIQKIKEKKKSVGLWKHRFDNHHKPVFKKLWRRNQYEYNNMIKKAKAEDKKGKLEKIVTGKDMAKLTRSIQNHPKHELGLLKDAHGILASTPEESLKILCDIHFHQSTEEEINQEERDLQQAKTQIGNFVPQSAEWRSSARVR